MVTTDVFHTGFQAKDEQEEFQFYFRQHWIRLLGPLARSIAVNVVVGLLVYLLFIQATWDNAFSRRLTLLVLIAIFVAANLEFLYRFYRYFLYVIVVTDKKIHRIKKTLITTDDHQSVDLWALQDISKSQHGLVQNLFGYGSLSLEAQETTLRLHFVPRVGDKYMRLMALQERARATTSSSPRFGKRG